MTKSPRTPVCDRCHNLIHHHEGTPIYHPSLESIQATIESSPYDQNHIYHVIDAVDFPMSLIPRLERTLELAPLRSRNRRAKQEKYRHGRMAEVSFVITRSDLIAPLKEQVDALMPYMRLVLKETIERKARRDIRLGNVYMVSAQRGWWTKGLKEQIWKRGGAGWMVGKVNVGKSNLFQVILPKGRGEGTNNQSAIAIESPTLSLEPAADLLVTPEQRNAVEPDDFHQRTPDKNNDIVEDQVLSDDNSLLPPAQKEVAYPDMPTVSDLPGTTAAPIRIPFGDGRGELIDLPGVFRSDIENYVLPEHRFELVMKQRITPEKIVIKEDKSLLLGNLIRITPKTPDIFIAHPFLTLKPHLTSTIKAVEIHNGIISKNISSVVTPEASESMRSAGTFKLKWDVTKSFTGPLTRRDAGKVRTSQLPFVVLSTDILIEGLGWVELTAQVRKKRLEDPFETNVPEAYPEVEVFSPEGRFIAQRRPMGASVLGGKKVIPKHKRRARPRMSMKSVKARRKPKSELTAVEEQ
jgi:genetic interactor of prohibitins 3, mitochondrial